MDKAGSIWFSDHGALSSTWFSNQGKTKKLGTFVDMKSVRAFLDDISARGKSIETLLAEDRSHSLKRRVSKNSLDVASPSDTLYRCEGDGPSPGACASDS